MPDSDAGPPGPPSRTFRQRLGDFFALDDEWERPGGLGVSDLIVGAITLLITGFSLELYRSFGALQHVSAPVWVQWLAVTSGALILVGRRRWPLSVAGLAAAHMFVVGVAMPPVMGQITMQVVYFVAYFSAVAWGRRRRETMMVIGLLVVFMFGWVAWQYALGSGVDELRRSLDEDADFVSGPIGAVTGYLLLIALVNLLYFGGAVMAGQLAWRSARQSARLAEQAALLQVQGEQLRRRAVVDERLRIARELHDVVAHHVSVIGVQAAAAKRVLGRDGTGAQDPAGLAAARAALGEIETSSREAVGQMRGLLGTLRTSEAEPAATRVAAPGLDGLADLVASTSGAGFSATYEEVTRPLGAQHSLPTALGHTLYRTVQEALANIRRHSTARNAAVVLRVDRTGAHPFVEIEITDDGRPRPGTSGSGLGQLGIRERVASHRGDVEIGPRAVGGYRVRVRLPLTPSDALAAHVPSGRR